MSVIASRKIARRIARKRASLDFLDAPRPSGRRAVGTRESSLRRTARTMPTMPGPASLSDPTHGLAARVPPLKNASTARGWTIFNGVVVYHESELEHRVSLRMQARNDISAFHSQFPVFTYKGLNGKLLKHTADYYAVFENGHTSALLVKGERKRKEMEELIEAIQRHPSSRQVHSIRLVTETFGTIEAFENAQHVIWYREFHHQPDVDELLDILRTMAVGWLRFGDLLKNCASIPRREAAIWRLLDLGILYSATGELITELSWLGYAPAGSGTGLLG